MAVLPPQILGFALSGAYPGMALLVLAGEAAGGTVGVTVVMGQEYLPRRMSLAGGVTTGLSLGLGGVGAPLIGLLADWGGLDTALTIPGLLLGLALPREARDPRRHEMEMLWARPNPKLIVRVLNRSIDPAVFKRHRRGRRSRARAPIEMRTLWTSSSGRAGGHVSVRVRNAPIHGEGTAARGGLAITRRLG